MYRMVDMTLEKLTISELEELQTVPIGYTQHTT